MEYQTIINSKEGLMENKMVDLNPNNTLLNALNVNCLNTPIKRHINKQDQIYAVYENPT